MVVKVLGGVNLLKIFQLLFPQVQTEFVFQKLTRIGKC